MGGEAEIKVIDELEIFKEGLQFIKLGNKFQSYLEEKKHWLH
jgi:hypothetical protein